MGLPEQHKEHYRGHLRFSLYDRGFVWQPFLCSFVWKPCRWVIVDFGKGNGCELREDVNAARHVGRHSLVNVFRLPNKS